VKTQGERSGAAFKVREVNAVSGDGSSGDFVSHACTVLLASATGVTRGNCVQPHKTSVAFDGWGKNHESDVLRRSWFDTMSRP
jgi:hypothetical protein